MEIEITDGTEADVLVCAKMMAATAPWQSFKYSIEDCIPKVEGGKWLKLAKRGNETAGFISYKPAGAGGMSSISLLCIAPEFRQQGIGAKLLKYAEDEIFSYDKNIVLFVTSFNEGAIRFYERYGYERVGEIIDYNYKGVSEYLYRKTTGPRLEAN